MALGNKMSLLEFQERFSTEEACRNYLFSLKWPDGFVCPRCGNKEYYQVKRNYLFQCKSCRHQTSLTAGTVMHRTRTHLRIWFWAIYLVAHDKRGRSALNLSEILGISYYRAWTMLHKIRNAMQNRDSLYTLGHLVEVDDSYFGAPTPNADGRGTYKAKVIISLSVNSEGKPLFVKMNQVPNIDKDSIKNVVMSNINVGSTIKTDGLNIYNVVGQIGYNHEPHIYYMEKESLHKWLHILISNAKAFIMGTYHGLQHKHIQAYLDEYCYRYNRRFWTKEIFTRLLRACVFSNPFTYAELTQ